MVESSTDLLLERFRANLDASRDLLASRYVSVRRGEAQVQVHQPGQPSVTVRVLDLP